MHKILEMSPRSVTNALYICDRQVCRNTWEGRPNERVSAGMRDFDLCEQCLGTLAAWIGEVPWEMKDHPARKLRFAEALPRARGMLSQVGELLNWLERTDGRITDELGDGGEPDAEKQEEA